MCVFLQEFFSYLFFDNRLSNEVFKTVLKFTDVFFSKILYKLLKAFRKNISQTFLIPIQTICAAIANKINKIS